MIDKNRKKIIDSRKAQKYICIKYGYETKKVKSLIRRKLNVLESVR